MMNLKFRSWKLLLRDAPIGPKASPSLQNDPSLFNNAKDFLVQKLNESTDLSYTASLHAQILKIGRVEDTVIINHLINGYIRLRETDTARKLFDETPEPNVVSWTSVISGYNHTGRPQMALMMFQEMHEGCSVLPNEFTFASVVKGCSALADLRIGKMVHARLEISGFRDNFVVSSSLVDMYGKCNDVETARWVFDLMGYDRNVVSWTSMITSYAQNGRGNEALELFREFNASTSGRPNQYILSSVIGACSSLGRLLWGKIAHGAVIRGGHELNNVVAASLLDMYAKSGCLKYSVKIFQRIREHSVISYTSMIMAMAKHGLGKSSLKLFQEMVEKRIKPNDVTLLGILYACSHSGLVDEGLEYFNDMYEEHGVSPDPRHYTCVVDMLGRVGRVDEAYDLAKKIKVGPDQGAVLWGALLSAGRLHGRVDIASFASEQLMQSGHDQKVTIAYVALSNVYAATGEWERSQYLRSAMKRRGMKKERGSSWLEMKDSIYTFHAGDLSCDRTGEIVRLLKDLERRMKERGHRRSVVAGVSVLVNIDEEEGERMVGLHSERLALAFGLLRLPKSSTIRIMKNLKMCGDCHEAFKLISEIVEREFVVRDVNRFHYFKNGSCNCNDFW